METIQDKNNAFLALCDILYDNYINTIRGFDCKTGKSLERQIKKKMLEFSRQFDKSLDFFFTEEKYKLINSTIQNSIGLKLDNLMVFIQ